MAIRPIVLMGDPRIFSVAERVTESEFNTPELNDLIKDMEDTMADANGVGLAAPANRDKQAPGDIQLPTQFTLSRCAPCPQNNINQP